MTSVLRWNEHEPNTELINKSAVKTGKKFQGCIPAQVIPEIIYIELLYLCWLHTHTTQTYIKINKNDMLGTYFISVRKNNHYNKLEGSCVSLDVLNMQ